MKISLELIKNVLNEKNSLSSTELSVITRFLMNQSFYKEWIVLLPINKVLLMKEISHIGFMGKVRSGRCNLSDVDELTYSFNYLLRSLLNVYNNLSTNDDLVGIEKIRDSCDTFLIQIFNGDGMGLHKVDNFASERLIEDLNTFLNENNFQSNKTALTFFNESVRLCEEDKFITAINESIKTGLNYGRMINDKIAPFTNYDYELLLLEKVEFSTMIRNDKWGKLSFEEMQKRRTEYIGTWKKGGPVGKEAEAEQFIHEYIRVLDGMKQLLNDSTFSQKEELVEDFKKLNKEMFVRLNSKHSFYLGEDYNDINIESYIKVEAENEIGSNLLLSYKKMIQAADLFYIRGDRMKLLMRIKESL